MATFKTEIQLYFDLGLTQKEMLSMLAHYQQVIISDRHLRRILRKLRLYRRKHYTDILEVALFIEDQLSNAGQLHGYRWMHMKCLQRGLVISRETVRLLLQILDPKGVQCRLRRRLRRRKYLSKGPDYTWHIDSYDKLKPYGLCVNGCIDGFSGFIIWMECYRTSSDPKIVAGYYINAIKSRRGCPMRVRGDRGTENGHVAAMQNLMVGENSFIYGTSTSNTKIESWWSILRHEASEYWIQMLSELKMEGYFVGSFLDVNLIQFCCMELLQVRSKKQYYICFFWLKKHIVEKIYC